MNTIKTMNDIVDVFEFEDGVCNTIRFLDTEPFSIANHIVDVFTETHHKQILKICLAWDDETQDDKEGAYCPYCEANIPRVQSYYLNAIIRSIQLEEPSEYAITDDEFDSGYKQKGTDSWTPVRVVKLNATMVARTQGLAYLNTHWVEGVEKRFPVSDYTYGMDVLIKYNSDAEPLCKYTIDCGNRTITTRDEADYLIHNITSSDYILGVLGRESVEQAQATLDKVKGFNVKYDPNSQQLERQC